MNVDAGDKSEEVHKRLLFKLTASGKEFNVFLEINFLGRSELIAKLQDANAELDPVQQWRSCQSYV